MTNKEKALKMILEIEKTIEENKGKNSSYNFINQKREKIRLEKYVNGLTYDYFIQMENEVSFQGCIEPGFAQELKEDLLYGMKNNHHIKLEDGTIINGSKIIYFKIEEYKIWVFKRN